MAQKCPPDKDYEVSAEGDIKMTQIILTVVAVANSFIAVGAVIYHAATTKAILKNDVKHLQADMTEVKEDIRCVKKYLLEHKD